MTQSADPVAPTSTIEGPVSRALAPKAHQPLSALLPEFLQKRHLATRTATEMQTAVGMLEDFFGEPRPIHRITAQDMIGYSNFLRSVPVYARQRFPGKTLREAIALNRERSCPFPTLGTRAINDKWLAHIKSILS